LQALAIGDAGDPHCSKVMMTVPFLVCASVTAISAAVSFGFSVAAILASTEQTRTLAHYAGARSLALVIASAVPFFNGETLWLVAIAWCMIIVQAGDAVIGVTIKDRIKTLGPAFTAAFNLAALIWLIEAGS
jgi:hypothetical protein